MKNLFRFILKYHYIILFLVIEFLSFVILYQHNDFHKASFLNFKYAVSGNMFRSFTGIKDYIALIEHNKQLARENNRLYNTIDRLRSVSSEKETEVIDTFLNQHYFYIPARVINNSINKQRNFITLNKGSNHGIAPEMAVINNEGLVGVVKEVSPNYASVISVLNHDYAVSAKIKKNGYFGPVTWDGKSHEKVFLSEIPHHVNIDEGDTIITSGYSEMYPEGILIGTALDYGLKGGNFLEIEVVLSTDFKKLNYVQVVRNTRKKELNQLENETFND